MTELNPQQYGFFHLKVVLTHALVFVKGFILMQIMS